MLLGRDRRERWKIVQRRVTRTRTSVKDIIAKAVAVFRQHPAGDYDAVESELKKIFPENDLAERLMEFVPLAYARAMFAYSGIGFDDTFARVIEAGKVSHFCPLSAEPLWNPAYAIAWDEFTTKRPPEDLEAVAKHSSIYRLFAQAAADGTDVRGGTMSPSIFLRPAPMPCPPPPPRKWWQIFRSQ